MRAPASRGRVGDAAPAHAANNSTHERRILAAMAQSIADLGYGQMTVAEIVRRARASRRTFYECFPDREAALVALLAETNHSLTEAISAAVDSGVSNTICDETTARRRGGAKGALVAALAAPLGFALCTEDVFVPRLI
jgi:AcrR family transcriptional regulator